MKQEQFKARHDCAWQEMETYLDNLDRGKPQTSFAASELPRRYRQLCQHLAIATARGYSRGVTDALHTLVLRAHQRFYGVPMAPWRAAGAFLLRDYPRVVRSHWRYLLAAAALFLLPVLLLTFIIPAYPEIAYTIIDPAQARQMEAMYDPELRERFGRKRESDDDFVMFAYYIRNNTSIGFQTFVGGLAFGLGTVFYLLFNGLFIGAIAGHLTGLGYIDTFWGFVAGHSAFELTAIMLSGAAGLKLGMALVAPGNYTRRLALRRAMSEAIKLMYGAAALFFAAAFVEAYWSSIASIPVLYKYLAGAFGWLVVLLYFVALGRKHAA